MQKNLATISMPAIRMTPEVCYAHLHYFLLIVFRKWAKSLLVLIKIPISRKMPFSKDNLIVFKVLSKLTKDASLVPFWWHSGEMCHHFTIPHFGGKNFKKRRIGWLSKAPENLQIRNKGKNNIYYCYYCTMALTMIQMLLKSLVGRK